MYHVLCNTFYISIFKFFTYCIKIIYKIIVHKMIVYTIINDNKSTCLYNKILPLLQLLLLQLLSQLLLLLLLLLLYLQIYNCLTVLLVYVVVLQYFA